MSGKTRFDIVCFDCDSTLSAVEGIDELGLRAGVGEELAQLTRAAMEGALKLEDVYGRRLALVRPDCETVQWLARRYIDERVEGAEEAVATLKRHGAAVHIVSGGIRQALMPLAETLGVDTANVHAVELKFDAAGRYAGYDETSPLARSGGKAEICRRLMEGGHSLALVGDGATDLEAAEVGAFIIGFGGIAEREVVRRAANAYVASPTLVPVLDHLLSAGS